jgi:DNA primase
MGAREDTQILNGLTVQAVGSLLGIKLPAKGMARCPFTGHDDDAPSFEVRQRGRRWICYGCDKAGGAIDLVMAYQGKPFPEAKRWLAEKNGLGSPVLRKMPSQTGHQYKHSPRQHLPEPDKAAEEAPPDHALYSALLAHAPLRKTGADYLRGRGLSDTILARFAIGQMPSIAMIRELIEEFDFARVEACGLLTKQSTLDRYWPVFPEGALLFPYFESGQITYFQARAMDDSVKGNRWRNLNHRRRRLYNADTLTDKSVRRVAICEGAVDVLSATQLGCEAVGLIGITAKLLDVEVMALRGRQVDLLLDWDDPGEKRATTLRKELARFGVAATRKSAPRSSVKDVNDYLREGNTRL